MISIRSRGGSDGALSLEGFSREELEKMEGIVYGGHNWMTVVGGVPKFIPTYKSLPDPVEDKAMLPFWRKPTNSEVTNNQLVLFEHGEGGEHYSPSISIRHLCGHYYTPEKYQGIASRLESFGFECLRSRRGNDGRYTEIWFLARLSAAKGDLGVRLCEVKEKKEKLERALDFLRRHRGISFGTLDVSVQRIAMPNPD